VTKTLDLTDPVELIAHAMILPNDLPFGQCWAPFQEQFFRAVFATVSEKRGLLNRKTTTRPRFRLVYDERRRGESKTEDCAAAALADLLTGPDWHRSYAVAADFDQAALIVDAIKGFIYRSPLLARLQPTKNVVTNPATGSELRVLSADDRTAYGVRARRVFFDELSLQPDERLWTAMWSAIGKNPESQMVSVSMAGWDFASLGWRIREVARTNPDYFFASREGSALAPWLSERDMEEQRVTLHPSDYARFWEARWTEPSGAWITRAMYDKAERGAESSKAQTDAEYVGSVDVGLVHDPSVVAVAHGEGERYVLDTLRTLQGTKDEPVQLEALEDLVVELTQRFRVHHWIFESPQAVASVQRLQNRLPSARVEARYPTADSMGSLFGTLYRAFSTERLTVFPHDKLRKEALNLFVKQVGGRLKVVDSSAIHQDHVVALGMCVEMLTEADSAEAQSTDQWLDSFGYVRCPSCRRVNVGTATECRFCAEPMAVVTHDPEPDVAIATGDPRYAGLPSGFVRNSQGQIFCQHGCTYDVCFTAPGVPKAKAVQ
jgi:terminase large subunit-like protein